jgi:hypothetical protein
MDIRKAGSSTAIMTVTAICRSTSSAAGIWRAVAPLWRGLIPAARAKLRFETQPGEQLQIDFGNAGWRSAAWRFKVYLFVAALGYSRRLQGGEA